MTKRKFFVRYVCLGSLMRLKRHILFNAVLIIRTGVWVCYFGFSVLSMYGVIVVFCPVFDHNFEYIDLIKVINRFNID